MISNQFKDTDAEVASLEGKLSRARQVTQGMMSVLLTGRVRLVSCHCFVYGAEEHCPVDEARGARNDTG